MSAPLPPWTTFQHATLAQAVEPWPSTDSPGGTSFMLGTRLVDDPCSWARLRILRLSELREERFLFGQWARLRTWKSVSILIGLVGELEIALARSTHPGFPRQRDVRAGRSTCPQWFLLYFGACSMDWCFFETSHKLKLSLTTTTGTWYLAVRCSGNLVIKLSKVGTVHLIPYTVIGTRSTWQIPALGAGTL